MSDDTKENVALGTGDQMAGEGQGGTQDDEATRRFKLFVGKNAEKFSALAEAEPNKRISFKFFNWAAMFVGVAWFFYRKLYLIGAAIIAVPLVLILVVPQFAILARRASGLFSAYLPILSMSGQLKRGLRKSRP